MARLWKPPSTGKIHVDDFRQHHLQQRQKDAFRRLSEPCIFHRRFPDDRRRVDRLAAMRDARDVKRRITVRQAVYAGMIAERALRCADPSLST